MTLLSDTLHWLAGILEGEGSFCHGPPSKPNACLIALTMTDEDVVAKVAGLFEVSYCKVKAKKKHWKNAFRCTLRGQRAFVLMQELRPLMGKRRQRQIEAAMNSHKPDQNHWMNNGRRVDVEEVLALRKKKFSFRKISLQTGFSHQHLQRVVAAHT